VQGKVLIDSVIVGSTGMPFRYTFRARKLPARKGEPPDILWPIGKVVAGPPYPDTDIDFGLG